MTEFIEKDGIIYHSLSGFYYVWADGEAYTTKPKGLFRHHEIKPLVGDRVRIEIYPTHEESEDRLIEIYPRKNELVRPPIANVDVVLVVMSLVQPEFSYNLLDHYLVSFEAANIQPIIVLTKYDLLITERGQIAGDALIEEIKLIYQKLAGYHVLISDGKEASYEKMKEIIAEGVYLVAGQSGVGKSTLINCLLPDIQLETAAISESLNRGRHTTRSVTLYPIGEALIADTPGFSALDIQDIQKEDLQKYFPEIYQKSVQCKFRSCVHINEPQCQVKKAVETKEIASSRYQNYVSLYERIDNQKPIYQRKK